MARGGVEAGTAVAPGGAAAIGGGEARARRRGCRQVHALEGMRRWGDEARGGTVRCSRVRARCAVEAAAGLARSWLCRA